MAEYYRNAWYAQLQKKVAELEEEIRKAIELPTVSAADEGKVLTVDNNGDWDAEDVPKELPTVTSADEGKVLTVDSEGKYVVEQPTKELPTVTSADEGMVLMVDNNGDWGIGQPLNYSLSEQVVGKWIDGVTDVYEITIVNSALNVGTGSSQVIGSIPNVDAIVSIDAIILENNKFFMSGFGFTMNYDSGDVIVVTGQGYAYTGSIHTTIRYTKPTTP